MVTQHEDKSNDWLEWRKKGIGSSDAPIITKSSPYATPFQLWEEKTGKVVKDQTTNWAQARGNELEPAARAKYELMYGVDMKVSLHEHSQFPFMRASMDGWDPESKKGIEIKFQGKEPHFAALNEKAVPPKYMPQLQHQIFVTGAESIDFISFNPDCEPNFAVVNVKPDLDWITNYLLVAQEFWKCVTTDTAPELTDKDARVIKDKAALVLAAKYQETVKTLKAMEEDAEKLREELLKTVGEIPKAVIGTLNVTRVWRKGNVDYKKVPELKGLDLEKYRGKSSCSYRIS